MLNQLLNSINSYLLGQISIKDLEEWLISNLQNIMDSEEQGAIDLANRIDADLVELSEGLIDKLTFRDRLQNYLTATKTFQLEYGEIKPAEPAILIPSSSNRDFRVDVIINPVEEVHFRASFV